MELYLLCNYQGRTREALFERREPEAPCLLRTDPVYLQPLQDVKYRVTMHLSSSYIR